MVTAFPLEVDCSIALLLCCNITLGKLLVRACSEFILEILTRSLLLGFPKILTLGFRTVRSLLPTGVTTTGKVTDLVLVEPRFCTILGLLRGDPHSLSIETVRTRCHAKSSSLIKKEVRLANHLEINI